jgi:hypothetical protein
MTDDEVEAAAAAEPFLPRSVIMGGFPPVMAWAHTKEEYEILRRQAARVAGGIGCAVFLATFGIGIALACDWFSL